MSVVGALERTFGGFLQNHVFNQYSLRIVPISQTILAHSAKIPVRLGTL